MIITQIFSVHEAATIYAILREAAHETACDNLHLHDNIQAAVDDEISYRILKRLQSSIEKAQQKANTGKPKPKRLKFRFTATEAQFMLECGMFTETTDPLQNALLRLLHATIDAAFRKMPILLVLQL